MGRNCRMLITFEGIDGSGKSTQAKLLVERLQSLHVPVLFVREPGGTELSERVRSIVLDPALEIAPAAELLLFSAARAQLVEERLAPELAAGRTVVCDRFFDSTTAYQGGGRKLFDVEWLKDFHRRVTGGLLPRRTYLIEIDPETALRSLRAADGAAVFEDRMEASGLSFQRDVASTYARIAEAEPERFMRLDGRQSPEDLHALIWSDVTAMLDRPGETSSGRSGTAH